MHSFLSRRAFLKRSLAGSALAMGMVPAWSQVLLPAKGLTFLFQGDSITDGNRGRTSDPNHIMGHGYAFSIASRVGADFAEAGHTFINRGISGNTVTDLQKRWQADTLDLKPNVLSILIGINDASSALDEGQTLQTYEITYRQLLKETKQAFSNLLLVLGIPFVLPVGARKENYTAWKEATTQRAQVVRALAREFGAVVVDYPKVFDQAIKKAPLEYWIWDGIHPSVPGHELMAREWIRQVSQSLPFLKKYKY
jgi:lysophospholipase L1-like esterase